MENYDQIKVINPEPQQPKKRSKKKVVLLIVILALVFLAVFAFYKLFVEGPVQLQEQTANSGSAQVEFYKSDEFSIVLPENWVAVKDSEELAKSNAIGAIRSENDKVAVFIRKEKTDAKLEDLESKLTNNLSSQEGFKKILSEVVEINGVKSLEFQFEKTTDGSKVKEVIYATPIEGSVYYLTITALSDDYKDYEETIKAVTNSYELLPR